MPDLSIASRCAVASCVERWRRGAGLAAAALLVCASGAAASSSPERPWARTEERADCAEYVRERRPLFGDLHVHTARSQDASTQDTRISPREAYRFARGQELGIQPYDDEGNALRRVRLDRPLDFAAVTDHAEQIGEVHICTTPGDEGYDSWPCWVYRKFPRAAFFLFNGYYSMIGSRWGFCGDDAENCLGAARVVWEEHQSAAEEAYDRSPDCSFTSLVGYEWTSAPNAAHLHRNVIFRNERVPAQPISAMETGPSAMKLWQGLEADCREGTPGCEAITIPHNTNWSAGTAFGSGVSLNEEITPEETPLRVRYERLVEMIQHKGESECALFPGVTDEGCGFEKAPNPYGYQEPASMDFTRDALKRGLEIEGALGANPLAFGQIGSTDTHLGTPGLVKERGHPGHGGAGRPGNDVLDTPGPPDLTTMNPGGLAVVWAEENSRDAIFAAMRRRETYATSGTRPSLRFFGGWGYDASICASPSLARAAYDGGVPMGGDLPARPEGASSPTFVVSALRDPHPNGADLDRVELVKGWLEDGEAREAVLTIAGGDTGASVDPATCERRGAGRKGLCDVWTDPDFDPGQAAFYYVRLREVPSCRWTQWACLDANVSCADPSGAPEGWEYCCGDEVPKTIQERAWSSPIWYRPDA